MFVNEKGRIWYGLHFYPGVAEYRENGSSPYRVFLNETTIRKMDATFPGRPVFVLHSEDELEGMSVDELKARADGWVIESFFNQADGKHWAKFITVSERADECIQKGWTLSNAYILRNTSHGGQWNGVSYDREITDASYDHLAIVPNPRYEESMILSPEDFKRYNEERLSELKKVANDKNEKRNSQMKFKMFKREKVENHADIENLVVTLTKSKKEFVIADALEQLDELMVRNADKPVDSITVKLSDTDSMTVGELKKKYMELKNSMDEIMKDKCNEDDEYEEEEEEEVVENEEDEEARKKALELAAHEEKEIAERKAKNKKKNSRELTIAEQKKKEKDRQKAEALRNAHKKGPEEISTEVYASGVEKGKARYGS